MQLYQRRANGKKNSCAKDVDPSTTHRPFLPGYRKMRCKGEGSMDSTDLGKHVLRWCTHSSAKKSRSGSQLFTSRWCLLLHLHACIGPNPTWNEKMRAAKKKTTLPEKFGKAYYPNEGAFLLFWRRQRRSARLQIGEIKRKTHFPLLILFQLGKCNSSFNKIIIRIDGRGVGMGERVFKANIPMQKIISCTADDLQG